MTFSYMSIYSVIIFTPSHTFVPFPPVIGLFTAAQVCSSKTT